MKIQFIGDPPVLPARGVGRDCLLADGLGPTEWSNDAPTRRQTSCGRLAASGSRIQRAEALQGLSTFLVLTFDSFLFSLHSRVGRFLLGFCYTYAKLIDHYVPCE